MPAGGAGDPPSPLSPARLEGLRNMFEFNEHPRSREQNRWREVKTPRGSTLKVFWGTLVFVRKPQQKFKSFPLSYGYISTPAPPW